MRRYSAYLWYVLRHKWFVLLAGLSLGVPLWQLLAHDWSKFRPSEFLPYARYFYEPDGSTRQRRDRSGYYKPDDTGDAAFDYAWFLHQKRNKHHWQWWTMPTDGGGLKVLFVPARYRREMLADWRGAGLAQGTPDTRGWWQANAAKLVLHADARRWLETEMAE